MRIRRRTAVWIGVVVVVLSLTAAGWRLSRPEVLRKEIQAFIQGLLAEGWEVEIDGVDYSLFDGTARMDGLRIVRTAPVREVVVKVPRVEANLSFSALFGRGRLATDLRVLDPEITVELGADGGVPLFQAFRAAESGGPSGHPRFQVTGGFVRLKDPGRLARDEEIVLALESLTVEESRKGETSGLSGMLVEKGSLGRVRLSGGTRELRVVVEKFTVDERLLGRLSPEVRETLAPFSLTGTLGEGAEAPALEVVVTVPPGGKAPSFQATARLRGMNLELKNAFPYPFTEVAGDATWESGKNLVKVKDLVLKHGAAEFHADAWVDFSSPVLLFNAEVWARGLLLDEDCYKALPPSIRKVWDVYAFKGEVDLARGSFVRRTAAGGPVEIDITARLVDAGLSFKGPLDEDGVRHGFDWPVDRVKGRVSLKAPVDKDGATYILLQDLRGCHGDTVMTAEGSVKEWPARRALVDITLKAKDVPLDASVRDCSPIISGLFQKFGPTGRLKDLEIHIQQAAVQDAPALTTVIGEFDGRGGMTWEGMPLTVEELSGIVAYRERLIEGRKSFIVEITGVRGTTAMGASVSADGTVEKEEDLELRLQVRAKTILLDGELEAAIRRVKQEVAVPIWDNLRPSGPVDLVVDVHGTSTKPRFSVAVALRRAYLEGWGEVRFPVADLTGTVDVTSEEIRLHSVRGMHGGREVSLEGGVRDLSGTADFDLALKTTDFPLDHSAKGILGETLSKKFEAYFSTVHPEKGLLGDATVRLLGPAADLRPTVLIENLRGGASPFDLKDLLFRAGTVRYEGGALAIEDLRGTMGDRDLRIARGALRLDRGEGSLSLEVRRLRFPADLVGLIPADTAAAIEEALPGRFIHFEGLEVLLSEAWRRMEFRGTVSLSPQREGATGGLGLAGTFRLDGLTLLRGEAEGDPTALSGGVDITGSALEAGVQVADLSGRLDLRGSVGHLGRGIEGTLSGVRARVAGRDLQDAGGELSLRDGVFLLQGLRGKLAGGDVGVSLEVGGQRAFEGVVTLSNARAREFFAPTDPDSPIRGLVEATVRFLKPRDPEAVLEGGGRVDIKEGKLFQVPVFAGISKLFGRKEPPEFTAGRLVFNIKADKLAFEEVELDSTVLTIHRARGKSAAYMDGRLDLKLLPEFKTGGVLWLPFDVASLLFKPIFERMYTIYVRGTVQRPEVSFEFLPGLFAPDLKDGPVMLTPPPAHAVERRAPWDF